MSRIILVAIATLLMSCTDKDARSVAYSAISKTAPIYPKEALLMGIEGHCILSFTITREGYTAKIKTVECSNSVFELAAIKAVSEYQYSPRKIDDEAVETAKVEEKFSFRIQEEI
ncbi:energy transducer TonB [uncultured Pseudoteredinibacter sp.]|uniref:energy transducer TonB n=1 Tax=uncultured Pseudoteredinibacter sp. TaxID=1641701 RepID=UPI0026171AF0|nr:energy transducer TonB [uncultured Pseudoteredinibacter sp.]